MGLWSSHMRPPILYGLFLALALVVALPRQVMAQENAERIANLETRVSHLESGVTSHADGGAVLWLFGAFCALWAQNTGRNPWLWFFLGMLFSVITVLVLLSKNANERLHPQTQSGT